MSRQLITEYRSELDRIHAASGSKRESVVREAFKDLLKRWGRSRDLIVLAEHEYLTPQGDRRYIDGALVHSIRVPFGYWEAKDTNDVLDEESLDCAGCRSDYRQDSGERQTTDRHDQGGPRTGWRILSA